MSIAIFSAASPADAAARPFEPAPLLIGFAVLALAAFSPAALNDGDTWTHVATGQWILAHGAIPRVDPFSYTFAGQPWIAHDGTDRASVRENRKGNRTISFSHPPNSRIFASKMHLPIKIDDVLHGSGRGVGAAGV